jgi:hypothetical protein
MEELVKRLQDIKEQVLNLKAQNELLLQDQERKNKELQRLKQLVDIQNSSLKQMEQKLKIKRIADEVTGEDDSLDSNSSRELKLKINEMIKEVDKIMTLMHQ